MTLQEAIRSGKKFRRSAVGGDYLTYADYVDELGLEQEDILAEDYELEPAVMAGVTDAVIAAAWNAARTGTNISPAGTSEFYKRFVAQLRQTAR